MTETLERIKTSLRVIGDKVVCKAIEADDVTRGGIYIPDTARERTMKGTVIFVGTGKRTEKGRQIPIDVKVGDTILFPKYGWSEVKIDGEDYLIINGGDILAVVE